MRTTSILILFSLAACASQHYDDDKNNPAYYDPKTAIVRDQSVRPEPIPGSGGPEVHAGVGLGSNDAAIAGVLATGILLAGNRDYYRSTAITGKCICGTKKDSNIQLPCTQVAVLILDQKGKELSRMEPTDGEFAFRVQKKLGYRLRVESKKYRISNPLNRVFYLGDDVILNLIQK